MKFQVGKYYKHNNGEEFTILARVNTTMYGKCFIAECVNKTGHTFKAIGMNKEMPENFKEITEESWDKHFKNEKKIKHI